MASQTITTFSRQQLLAHTSKSSCYITIGNQVYDVTDFINDHPGGRQVILDHAGKDIRDILQDSASHTHSETAYEILEECFVGHLVDDDIDPADGVGSTGLSSEKSTDNSASSTVQPMINTRTGMSCAEDLTKETDADADFKTHKFLDLNRPMFPQLWYGGFTKRFYLDQIHRPRHYKGAQSAPLFGNFLEPLTKTPWWMIPLLWLPCVAYGTWIASQGLPPIALAASFLAGLFIWTLVEYCMHRFFFHLDDLLPDHRVALSLHFLLHGVHHYLPMDRYRLVMPPALFVILAYPLWPVTHLIVFFSWHVATALYAGVVMGYICYDLTHYFLHHKDLPLWYQPLKKYHLEHHFLDYENGFGVSSRFWDRIFGTEIVSVKAK